MKKNFTSILLRYKNKNRILYQTYAEFLRLAGIYVCEDIYEADEEDKWAEFDFSIRYEIPEDEIEIGNGEERALKNLKNELSLVDGDDVFGEGSDLYICYDDIRKIFVKNYLLTSSVTLQYFRMESKLVEEAGENFARAADEFVELIKKRADYQSNRHIRYAKLYCKQKANLAQYFCGNSVFYYVNNLAEEGLGIMKQFPDFSNAWVLLGLVYEISKDYGRDAIDAFQRAIALVNNQPYAANIYYWLGKRYEEYDSLYNMSDESYQAAYNVVPKYRNAYKVAVSYMQKGKWEQALLYFDKALQLLEIKGDFKDPLEQEYYFKVNLHIGYIFLQKEEYDNTINSVDKALTLRKGLENTEKKYIDFYDQIYGGKSDEYRALELQRMGIRQAYLYKATALQKMNQSGQAEKYWDKIRQ